MKRFIFIITLLASIACFPNGWTPCLLTPKQKEKNAIMQKVMAIREQYTRLGGTLASSAPAVFKLLKDLGSEASYELLQEMIKNCELPKHYLTMA